ncbi:MAG: hypothetical protein L3J19_02585 [Sulfurimonas sp.]|nr:hypothetical protein [Sulfurimonas sp.]
MKTLLLILLLNISLLSAEYAVVVNNDSSISSLSQKQIRDIFVMKRHFIDTQKVVSVNMPSTSKLRDIFEKKILKINRDKLSKYWVKQHFQGVRPPIIQSSHSSMKLFIKNVSGAVGYLPISSTDSDLRIVFEF